MADRQWTAEQKKAIDLSGRNLLVSAAAGSGKTAVLVERILMLLTKGNPPLCIDELLIVTFTNAAAAEMRERIGDAIEKQLLLEPENDHLQRQQTLLSTAMIMTIDSFCMNVVKNYFSMIDLDPAFRLGDEVEMELLQADVLEEMLEKKYEDADPVFLRFVECYGGSKSDAVLETMIRQMFRASESYPWPLSWLEEQEAAYTFDSVTELKESEWMKQLLFHTKELLAGILLRAESALMLCRETDGPDSYEKAVIDDIEQIEQIALLKDYDEIFDALQSLSFTRLSSRTKEGTSEQKKEAVKELRNAYKKISKEIQDTYFYQSFDESFHDLLAAKELMLELISLTKEFHINFSKKKEERNLLDFSDIEHYALKILVNKKGEKIEPTQAAEAYREQFAQIMIDEYQDSNLVQETILTSISREKAGYPNLFMVGDVKQSIYRFRLARPELFMEKYERYSDEDSAYQKIDLSQNFRSRKEVLNSVNYLFEWFMKKEFGRIDYDAKAALYPGRTFISPLSEDKEEQKDDNGSENKKISVQENYDSELILIAREAEEDGEDEAEAVTVQEDSGNALTPREMEAYAIADRIKQLTDKEHGLLIEGKEGLRRAGFGDITILLRSMQGWSETFTSILLSEGIPTISETRTGFFQTMEIQTVLNYLRILDNPRQDIPLAAVLYSPIVQLNSEELAAIRDTDKPLMDAVRAYVSIEGSMSRSQEELSLAEKLDAFLKQYDYLRRCAVHEPIHELLRTLYDTTLFLFKVSLMPFGDRRRANLILLVSKAKSYEETSYHGVFHFIRYVERLLNYEIDFGEAGTAEDGSLSVRIMSVHKSKGLEFPVVFVAGMGKKFNTRDLATAVVIHPELGIGPECIDEIRRTRISSLPKAVIKKALLKESIAEELRVLYVALTRAREKLIMTGTVKQPLETVLSWCNQVKTDAMDNYALEKSTSFLSVTGPAAFRDAYTVKQEIENHILSDTPMEAAAAADEGIAAQGRERVISFQIVPKATMEQTNLKVRFVQCKKPADIVEGKREDAALKENLYERLQAVAPEDGFKQDEFMEYKKRLQFEYPYQAAAKLPMKVSVSELKHRAMEEAGALDEAVQMFPTEKERTLPKFKRMEYQLQISPEDTVHAIQNDAMQDKVSQNEPMQIQQNEPDTGEKNLLPGSERGTLYHTIMENLPFQMIDNTFDLSAVLDIIEANGKITKQQRVFIKEDLLTSFFRSTLFERMKAADAKNMLFREQPFVIGVEDPHAPDEYQLIQGIIDCFFEEDGKLVLVDYKTDRIREHGEDILLKRYQVQMDYYARALEQCTGKIIKEKLIYSFALSKTIKC